MKQWRRLPSLPLQLFIITVLPLTALLLLITFGSLGLHQRAMRNMVGERDERATRAAAAAITEQINHRQSAIRSVALQAANAVGPEHALADASYLLPDFEGGIALFSGDGMLQAASNAPEIWQARAMSERLNTFSPESAGDEAYFLPPFIDPVSSEELTLIAATVDGLTAVGAFSPTSLARREVGRLMDELRQEVGCRRNRIVGFGLPQVFIAFAVLFIGIIANSRRVGQQMENRHCRGNACSLQAQEIDNRCVERQQFPVDQLQRRNRGKQLGDRCRVEAHLQ